MADEKKTGRPTKFTPARIALILSGIRNGVTRTAAAGVAGITRQTLHEWETADPAMVLPEDITMPPLSDRDDEVVYEKGLTFPDALTRAEDESEQFLISRIKRAGTEDAKTTYVYDRQGNLLREIREYDWRAGAWLLEHNPKLRAKYQTKQGVEISGPDGGPVQTEGRQTVNFKPDDDFLRRVATLAEEVLPDGTEDQPE